VQLGYKFLFSPKHLLHSFPTTELAQIHFPPDKV
jgi:hypothetical protein